LPIPPENSHLCQNRIDQLERLKDTIKLQISSLEDCIGDLEDEEVDANREIQTLKSIKYKTSQGM